MVRGRPVKVDKDFEKQARKIMRVRLEKGLSKFKVADLGMPEFTRLLIKTPHWNKIKEELKSLKIKGKNKNEFNTF